MICFSYPTLFLLLPLLLLLLLHCSGPLFTWCLKVPIRANPRRRSVNSVYKTYIDVIHFRKSAKGRLTAENANADEKSEFHTTFDEGDETESTRDARRQELEELSQDPDVYNKLTAALAPSIWELDDVKKGVLLMLFGGVNKKLTNKSLRGEINVLLYCICCIYF